MYIDFFDSFGSEIYIEYFGLNIKRILPKINKIQNIEWITDRIRFFYDSLQIQKIVNCYLKLFNSYQLFSWFGVFLYFKMIRIFNLKNFQLLNKSMSIYYYLNTNVDLNSLIFLNYNFLKFNFFEIITNSSFDSNFLNIDYLKNFFLEKNFLMFENINNLLLFGYNIRCEHPLLFIKLIELVRKKKIKLYIFGVSFFFLNYKIIYLGLNVKDFFFFFYKKYIFKNNTLILIGSSFLSRIDFFIFFNFFKKLNYILNKILFNINIYYLFFYLLDLNLLFLGFKNDFRNKNINKISFFQKIKNSFNFFFFENDCFFKLKVKQTFLNLSVFLGSNFLFEFQKYDLILPISFFFEKDNFILNLFYNFSKLKFIFSPQKNIKNSINLFYLINNSFNIKNIQKLLIYFKYSFFFLVKLSKFIFYINKNLNLKFLKFFYCLNNFFFKNFIIFFYDINIYIYIYNNFFNFLINNFYYTNIYSHLSKNLSLAFIQFNKKLIFNIN